MNKFVIGLIAVGAVCAGVCRSASSADLAVRPAAPVLAPIWTGFYVGGNIGSAWAQDDTTISATIPVGGGLGVSAPLTSQSETGFIGGVQGGYNYQWGAFVLGIEADADWSNLKGTTACAVIISCTSRIKSFGDIGGRAGVVVFDRALVYLKGGWAWADTDFNASFAFAGFGASTGVSTTRSGGFVGTGIEYAFVPNWSAKVEYDYYDFGTKNFALATTPMATISASSKLTEHVVKFGVNYKFWYY